MFNFQEWIDVFKQHLAEHKTAYNDAESYGVTIEIPENRTWRVLGIHKLLPGENKGKHNVFVEMLCKQNEREGFRAIQWTWEGRKQNETAHPVFAGQKALDELIDLPIHLGMKIDVWTQSGEVAKGFHSDHPDEEKGNTRGHHSFFICFQEIDRNDPFPEPEPPAEEIEVVSTVAIMVNQEYVASLEPDDDGNVMIVASVLGV